MWDLSNPTQILKLRMKHVRAGKMSQLTCPDTHVLWVIRARGTPVPTGSTGPAPPLSLLPWFTGWRAICSCFFLPNFGLMTQIIKKLLLYFFESIAHPIIHACFPQHSVLPSKYWLDCENGNNRRIYFHSNNWTKHFWLKISISEKKKTYWKTYYYGNINKMYLLEIHFLFEIFIEKCTLFLFLLYLQSYYGGPYQWLMRASRSNGFIWTKKIERNTDLVVLSKFFWHLTIS